MVKWEKIIDDSNEIAYGEPNTSRVIRAEKWSFGWAIKTGKELNSKENERVYALETYTNAGTKADAKRMMLEYIDEQPKSMNRTKPMKPVLKIIKKGKSGWKSESARHALASKGIRTGVKSKPKNFARINQNRNIKQYIKDYRLGNLTLSKGGNSQDFVNRLIDYFEKKEGA